MKKYIILFLTIGILSSSCEDFLDMPPKNTKVVYTMADVKEAVSMLLFATTTSSYNPGYSSSAIRFNGDYIQYPFVRYGNVGISMYTNDIDMTKFLDVDHYASNYGGNPFLNEYRECKNWEGSLIADRYWLEVFSNVGFINMILKDLEGVPDYDKTNYELISGEVRVMRAYYLFRLNQLFAPYDNNDYGIPFNFDAEIVEGGKRWKQTDLYQTLIKEITDVLAYETLPDEAWNIFYNERIIYAILAQIYHYKAESCAGEADDWEKAAFYAKEARGGLRIENTVDEQRELTTPPRARTTDKPHDFALLRISKHDYWNRTYAPWGYAGRQLSQSPTEDFYQLYDDHDIRREVYFTTENNTVFIIKMLYNGYLNNTTVLFRYSDLMLIEAEALARMDKSGALELLNEFKKSKITNYTGYTGTDLIGEILKERRKEFFLEEQMNWLDMKRTRTKVIRKAKDDATGEIITYTLEGDDYRYALPIPADSELLYNNNISQNPGWPL